MNFLSFDPSHFSQWDQFLELGKDISDSEVEKIVDDQKPGECCLLVYTVKQQVVVWWLVR